MTTTSPVPDRFVIPAAAVSPETSISIPLQVLQIEGGGYKVGINVTLTDPATGATAEQILYEFDTGGKGFYASIPHELRPQFPMPSPAYGAIYNHYSSGIEYFGQAVMLNVGFPQATTTESFPMLVGFVDSIEDWKEKKLADGTKEHQHKKFPIFGYFYGDFGASPQASAIEKQEGKKSNDVSLLTMLAQLPEPYRSGFIVDLGPYPAGAPSTRGMLIAGLTPQLRELLPLTVKMQPQQPYPPQGQPVPRTQVATYDEIAIKGTLKLGARTLPQIGLILDTGAPVTTLHHGKVLGPQYTASPEELLSVTVETDQGEPVTLISFHPGKTPSVDKVDEGKHALFNVPQGYINTGIAAFFNNPIAFDLENGVIRFPRNAG